MMKIKESKLYFIIISESVNRFQQVSPARPFLVKIILIICVLNKVNRVIIIKLVFQDKLAGHIKRYHRMHAPSGLPVEKHCTILSAAQRKVCSLTVTYFDIVAYHKETVNIMIGYDI